MPIFIFSPVQIIMTHPLPTYTYFAMGYVPNNASLFVYAVRIH